eukprot:8844059-Pyramimonas_sp.AAC.1
MTAGCGQVGVRTMLSSSNCVCVGLGTKKKSEYEWVWIHASQDLKKSLSISDYEHECSRAGFPRAGVGPAFRLWPRSRP